MADNCTVRGGKSLDVYQRELQLSTLLLSSNFVTFSSSLIKYSDGNKILNRGFRFLFVRLSGR